MNQKIKEMAVNCGIMFESKKQTRTHAISTETLNKFAELIIKDNIQTLRNNGYDDAASILETQQENV
jgi:hypothetical protein